MRCAQNDPSAGVSKIFIRFQLFFYNSKLTAALSEIEIDPLSEQKCDFSLASILIETLNNVNRMLTTIDPCNENLW